MEEQIMRLSKQQTFMIETLRGIRTIKVLGREDSRKTRWMNLLTGATNAQVTTEKLTLLFKAANGLIFGLQSVAVVWLGATLVLGGEKVRREALETPAFVVVMTAADPDEITREEDYAAAMMAVENLMIAAESLGLGTYLRTGGIMREPALAELVGLDPGRQRIVGVLSLGYPAEREPPRRRKPAGELTRWLD
jgi:nitroreductase